MEARMPKNIRTLDSLIHAKFVSVDVIDKQDDGSATLRVTPTNDPDSEIIALRISKARAEELDLATLAA
jgi:hypothetical protein